MHPELFTIPGVGISIKTYGFFLTVGFLTGVWLNMRRAARVKANPDHVLDLSFISLVCGVGGARLFYVMHYWQTDFAFRENKLLAIIDIRQGGLEFIGGLLGATIVSLIFLYYKKLSIRLYFDIYVPGLVWGLAFGRIGCFFNGCCFGGVCTVEQTNVAKHPWAISFPYGSPAQVRQWEDRLVTVPAELIVQTQSEASILPASALSIPPEKKAALDRPIADLTEALAKARGADSPDAPRVAQLAKQLEEAKAQNQASRRKLMLDLVERSQQYPSRKNPERRTSRTELGDLAAQSRSLPIHPTQLYSAINAMLLSFLLGAVFYIRKRHGVVFGLLLVLYPISRAILELIRTDNPHDVAGLTISQFVGGALFLFGLTYLFVLYKYLPERSPALANEKPFSPKESS